MDYEIDGRPFHVKGQDPVVIHLSAKAPGVTIEKARYGVLGDPNRTRDMREKVQRLVDSGQSSFKVALMAEGDDPAYLVVKTLEIDYLKDGKRLRLSGTDPDTIDFSPTPFRRDPWLSCGRMRRDVRCWRCGSPANMN